MSESNHPDVGTGYSDWPEKLGEARAMSALPAEKEINTSESEGYVRGHSDGYSMGYDAGYEYGYKDGFKAGCEHPKGL